VLKPFTEKGKRAKDKDYLYLIMPIKGWFENVASS
jgi:hypothetical protein